MDFIKPTPITDSLFTSSTVPETDYDEWSNTALDFNALSAGAKSWRGICTSPNGNVYASVYGGSIWMQTNGTGAFVDLVTGNKNWVGMCAAPNGNIYACVNGGSIWMQTNGTGAFVDLVTGNKAWAGMCAAPNGNIYASVYGGSIWMQTSGTGAFVDLALGAYDFEGMCAAPNGNIYVCVNGGSIWKQTNGSGAFVDLAQTTRYWRGMCATPKGNIYASAIGNDFIYMQTNGTGDFADIGESARDWYAMGASPNGNVYGADSNDIYMQDNSPLYFIGDEVIVTDSGIHKIYESLTNNNFDNYPSTHPTDWLEISATNRWKAFDGTLGSQTSQATSMIFALAPGAVDSVALLNLESTSIEIDEIDNDDNLITNGEDWTGATGTTQPTGWSKVGTPSNFLIDDGMLKITVDAANEGISETKTVVAATKYQLLGIYKNISGDIAQIAVYDVTHGANILATTDLASSTVNSIFSYVFTTPAGCTSIRISIMGKTSGDIVWFDSVKLAPTEYSEIVTTGTSKTDVVKLDLLQHANGIITITINYAAGTAKIGEIIVGLKTNIGTMKYSPSIGITDYSTKTVDTFGHYSIVERSFAKRMTCNLIILNTAIDEIVRLLSLYRATELVWVGSETYSCLIVYGFYKDFQIVIPRPLSSDCSLEIEGLT